jgi:predicted small lipoprotein YifL
MRRRILAVTTLALLVALGLAACEDKGPLQKAGEKIDRATDQDKVIGKGPLEKAGKNVDDTVKDLKK